MLIEIISLELQFSYDKAKQENNQIWEIRKKKSKETFSFGVNCSFCFKRCQTNEHVKRMSNVTIFSK